MAGDFYYDVTSGQVQEVEKRGQAKDLMGPYPTREAAQHALEGAKARTQANDAADRAEEDW
ncbi:MAG: hypothetical protein ACRYF3_06090 [Janthinobacterium lividum]